MKIRGWRCICCGTWSRQRPTAACTGCGEHTPLRERYHRRLVRIGGRDQDRADRENLRRAHHR